MPARRFLSKSIREMLFGIPFGTAALERFYVLAEEDLALVRSRRKPENRLGLAIHLALLRHPGQGWQEGVQIPEAVVHWLCEQVNVSPLALAAYGDRQPTRATHRSLAIRHLGLRPVPQRAHVVGVRAGLQHERSDHGRPYPAFGQKTRETPCSD